ncbi:MAG: mechanosensitive ion channel [Bacteroidales bacterium]|nr:mechanosensitive ion channel [Candidatus Liminaster caballi]
MNENNFIAWFERNLGSDHSGLEWYWRLLIVAGVILASYLVDVIFSRVLIPAVRKITDKTETNIDDVLLSDKVCKAFSNILPAIILTFALPFVTKGTLEIIIGRVTTIYIIVCVTRFLCVLVRAVFDVFIARGKERAHSLKGLVQTIQIVISLFASILIISVLIDKSPVFLLSGLGAMAAVLMLVFQDSIKGLVAGVQLMFNDMLVVGDWIVMSGRNVDGVVIEITLTTVKVRNWDNTILTVPPYSLLTETFQNWRGMQESDGRRFSRHINVDMHSVKFVNPQMLKDLEKKGLAVTSDAKVGQTTNLELYRHALQSYLEKSPDINPSMTLMVRQLTAGSEGIPVQMYAFTRTKEWEKYEEIQSRLTEYALCLLGEYGLRPYQRGSDFRQNICQ